MSKDEVGTIIFNSKTGAMAIFDPVETLLLSKESVVLDEESDIVKMGFFTTDKYESWIDQQDLRDVRYSDTSYWIHITNSCNANCDYCYAANTVGMAEMSGATVDKIINFIISHRKDNTHLTFSGGEPLLRPDIISKICKSISDEKMEYDSAIVTNGSLLTKEIIDKFSKWSVKSVQVPLDGYGALHTKIKKFDSPEISFESIIKNAKSVIDSGLKVTFRLNIGKSNVNSILDLIDYIGRNFSKEDVSIRPALLFSTECYEQGPEIDNSHNLLEVVKKIDETGFSGDKEYFNLTPKPAYCRFMCDKNSFIFYTDGTITKCPILVGIKEKVVGSIDPLEINSKMIMDWSEPIIDLRCNSCSLLPICGGGCKAKYDREHESARCHTYKDIIQDILKIIAKNKIKEQDLKTR
ncbi:MAG: radical SAM protein [Methanomassiliicoccaceae archaeon]|nr:radical SAM protein [Methanomassiliicoccaceae archaeon]